MSPLTALLVFAGIPIAFAIVVWALLSRKTWERGADAPTALEASGPYFVVTGPALPDPARLPRDLDTAGMNLVGGGARGSW